MTILTDRPATRDEWVRGGRVRGLTITVIVLVLALIGLGAWAVYDYVGERDSAVSGDVQTLLDDYTAAWNEHDGTAFLALVTSDYTFDNGVTVTSAEDQAVVIGASTSFAVEVVGEAIMVGDGPWTVAQANQTTYLDTDSLGMSILTVVEQGGVLKVASHVWNLN